MSTKPRVIMAGGGTGGHIFPAIAIANAIKKLNPDAEILFIGAKGKMEMEKVPQSGYKIEGLDIAGFNRSSLIKNLGLPFKLIRSFFQVRSIFSSFQPTAVVGVGGYSSFPVLRFAQSKGIPTFIHEANSFAGKSNMLLGKKATLVFTGTDGMEKFFPADKIMVTGNPVRSNLLQTAMDRATAVRHFGLDPAFATVLVTGGSLGAKGINEAIANNLDQLIGKDAQLIWQTGKPFLNQAKEAAKGLSRIWVNDFITEMDIAYAAADIVVSRAGAMALAELAVVKKPAVLVPYPLAAEDHQTVNAKRLVDKQAAIMVADADAKDKLVLQIRKLVDDTALRSFYRTHIAKLAITDADTVVAKAILEKSTGA
ncbi:MAG: undecaprenyldiphospho-muramoylpentapeptide beta-N-acetylglucosaminyltransferase [Chitinophagaceae bacterium]|nr:undecaprenyldiphospho-muramoylpentapeptide beta-N-acetylglucosaminyltransferase [Chitinophagaceae bacterium]